MISPTTCSGNVSSTRLRKGKTRCIGAKAESNGGCRAVDKDFKAMVKPGIDLHLLAVR